VKVLVVLAHPERRSFNGALFDAAVETLTRQGHSVETSDLYRMAFEARSGPWNFLDLQNSAFFKPQAEEMHAAATGSFAPELETEIRKLETADLVILQFPLWWFGLPAIMKGWVDRVFAMGRAYGRGRIYEKGHFLGKRALLSLTTGGFQASYITGGEEGDILGILRPIHRGIFRFTGFDVLAPSIFYGPARVEESVRAGWLLEYTERLKAIEREEPIEVGSYA
jgi:NAD(P)H dehydrogenase (quinone)